MNPASVPIALIVSEVFTITGDVYSVPWEQVPGVVAVGGEPSVV